MIQCPYDSAHWISKERIQYHLVKCQKQHPHADLVKCPYNACHLVPKTKEAEHMAECPDRRIVEYQKYRFNAPTPGQHGFLANPEKYGSDDIPVEPLRDPDEDDHLEGEDLARQMANLPRSRLSRHQSRRQEIRGRAAEFYPSDDDEVAALTSPGRRPSPQRNSRRSRHSPRLIPSPGFKRKSPSLERCSPLTSSSYHASNPARFRVSSIRGGRQTPPPMDEELSDISRITDLAKGVRKKMVIPEKIGLGRGSRGQFWTTEDDCGDTTDAQSVASMMTHASENEDELRTSLHKYGGKIGLGRGHSGPGRKPPAVMRRMETESSHFETASASSTVGPSGYDIEAFSDVPDDTDLEDLPLGLGRGGRPRDVEHPGLGRGTENKSKLKALLAERQRSMGRNPGRRN